MSKCAFKGAIAQFPTQNSGHEYYKRLNCEKASRHKYIKIVKKLLGISKVSDNIVNRLTGIQVNRSTGRQIERMTGQQVDKLTGRQLDRLKGRQVDRSTG